MSFTEAPTRPDLGPTLSAQRALGTYPTWDVLSWLLLFRLGLTFLLMVLFSPIAGSPLMEGGDSVHTWAVSLGYGILVPLSGLAIYVRWPDKDQQVQLAVFVDMLFFNNELKCAGRTQDLMLIRHS